MHDCAGSGLGSFTSLTGHMRVVIRSRGERPGTGLVASWTARAGTPVDTSLVIGVVVGSVGGLLVLVGAGFAIAKWKPKRKGELVQGLRATWPCCFLVVSFVFR